MPAGTALLLLAVIFGVIPNFDNDAVGRRRGVESAGYSERYSPRPPDSLHCMEGDNQPDSLQPSMVLVAAQGGASRAGFWTAEVLAKLDELTEGGLRNSLFAINAVSGGAVGATGYLALLHEHPTIASYTRQPLTTAVGKSDPECETNCFETKLRAQLKLFAGRDVLGPVLTGMLFPDLLYRFFPVSSSSRPGFDAGARVGGGLAVTPAFSSTWG